MCTLLDIIKEEINNKIALYNKYYQDTNEIDPKTGKIRKATIDDAIYEIVADSCDQIMRSKEMEQRLKAEAPKTNDEATCSTLTVVPFLTLPVLKAASAFR